jgi:hypothetical protein
MSIDELEVNCSEILLHHFLGLGNYAQEASQYGPTRGGLSDAAFAGGVAAAGGGVPTSVYGGEPGGYPSASMYDGMGRGGGGANASRGYHPYGR